MSNKISYKDQLKTYLFNHYNKLLADYKNNDELEELLEQIIGDDKSKILKFVNDNNILHILKAEFKDLLQEKEIETLNNTFMKLYCGIV